MYSPTSIYSLVTAKNGSVESNSRNLSPDMPIQHILNAMLTTEISAKRKSASNGSVSSYNPYVKVYDAVMKTGNLLLPYGENSASRTTSFVGNKSIQTLYSTYIRPNSERTFIDTSTADNLDLIFMFTKDTIEPDYHEKSVAFMHGEAIGFDTPQDLEEMLTYILIKARFSNSIDYTRLDELDQHTQVDLLNLRVYQDFLRDDKLALIMSDIQINSDTNDTNDYKRERIQTAIGNAATGRNLVDTFQPIMGSSYYRGNRTYSTLASLSKDTKTQFVRPSNLDNLLGNQD